MSETASPTSAAGNIISRKEDIGSLIAALASPDRVTRQTARETLVAVGHPAVGPLIALLDDRHDHVRWEAAKSLADIGDPAAAPGTGADPRRSGRRDPLAGRGRPDKDAQSRPEAPLSGFDRAARLVVAAGGRPPRAACPCQDGAGRRGDAGSGRIGRHRAHRDPTECGAAGAGHPLTIHLRKRRFAARTQSGYHSRHASSPHVPNLRRQMA